MTGLKFDDSVQPEGEFNSVELRHISDAIQVLSAHHAHALRLTLQRYAGSACCWNQVRGSFKCAGT